MNCTKMFFKRNLLENLGIISYSGTTVCIILHFTTNISPVQGVWFLIYTLTVFFLSILISFKFIQWLLRLNKPIKYDLDHIMEKSPYLSFLSQLLPDARKKPEEIEFKEYDTNELSVISTVLEKKLVSSWYMPYISQEISFPFACKQMLDQMIGKAFQICHKVNTKDVYIDICMVLTSHLKEYQKTLKRHEKCNSETIESLYKKTHPTSDSSKKISSTDHCCNLLRVVLKELVPWELWDTPHSELLVRILSKKVDHFISQTLINPVWLNDKLLTILKSNGEIQTTDIHKKKEEVLKTEIISEDSSSTKIGLPTESVVEDSKVTKELIQKSENVEEVSLVNDSVEATLSPVLRQHRGRQGRSEVKIYDRVIEGSVKTWETDMDLQCISLGQDLLASLDGEITLSRLWGQDVSPNPPRVVSPQPLWFGEEDMDIDIETSPHKESKKDYSPKPTDALLKDIQSTVSQAKTKIGDLQDEAAGMMEGLLDFGIAGLKKGLRFTGLSDDSQQPEKPLFHQKPDDKTPPDIRSKPIVEHIDSGVTFLLDKEENGGGSTVHPLLKQQRVISQDSVPSQPKPIIRGEFPPPPIPMSDSPEPQYEEVADLSTSIAKLRSLLQQRALTQRTEDVWWESAEETRGRTQHHHSSKPVDTATLADEYDMNLDRNSSPGMTTNNMQRLDKLFQRTVTGVFNSIKTAVGAEGEDSPSTRQPHDWVYVCTSAEHTVGGSVGKLVGARRAFTHVDAALDSLEQLSRPTNTRELTPEDLDLAESLINTWLDDLTSWLKEQVFVSFQQMSSEDQMPFTGTAKTLRKFHLDETCRIVLDKIPLLYVFGKETLSDSVKLTISSFSHKEVNRDVVLRILDLLVLHFKNSAALRNPSFDGN